MRYYRFVEPDGSRWLGAEMKEGIVTNLTAANPELQGLADLLKVAYVMGMTMDEVATKAVASSQEVVTEDLSKLVPASKARASGMRLDRPLDPPEVWAVGVTYKSSEMERRRESKTPDIYARVYGAERPEIFFKATPERCSGPGGPIGIRTDSTWNVPEPELAFVLYKGEIVGYTIGNDMSSRSIEGENPLYLPQAKVFRHCCAIGPCVVSAQSIGNPHNLAMECRILRNGEQVFRGSASTSQMARKCDDLADWLQRHNPVPDLTVVLTGTAIIPPESFTLKEGDVVQITIEKIGTLENTVVEV